MSAGQEGEAGLPPAEEQRSCPAVSLAGSLPEEPLPSQQDCHHPLPGGCERFPGQKTGEKTDQGRDDHSEVVEIKPGEEGGERAVPQHQGQGRHHTECVAREEGETEISETQVQHCPLSGCCARLDCPQEDEETERGGRHHPAGSEESRPGNIYHKY